MGLGDFLRGADSFLDNLLTKAPVVGDDYANYLEQDRQRLEQQRQAGEHPSLFKAVGGDLGAVDATLRGIPGAGAVLDLPNRSWDTLFLTAQHASAVGEETNSGLESLKAMVNGNNWAKAWSSWGDEDHVSAGQILGSAGSLDFTADPFQAKDVEAIQNAVDDTWYGEAVAGATDLAASMTVPGLGTAAKLKAASGAAKSIETGADAERLAQRFAAEGADPANANKLGDIRDELLKRPERDDDSFLGRLAGQVEKTNDIHDMDSMLAHLSPMMENSTDGARVILADVFTQANRLDDADMRTAVKINAMLAAHGSTTARAALVRDFPLLAKNLEEMTSAPRGIQLANELVEARLAGASDDTINGVLDRHFNLRSDQAELDALKHEIELAQVEARAAKERLRSFGDTAPTGLKGEHLQRTDAPDALWQSPSEKPHGLYLTKPGEKRYADEFDHFEGGHSLKDYTLLIDRGDPAVLKPKPIKINLKGLRGGDDLTTHADSGVAALRHLLGKDDFSSTVAAARKGKSHFAAVMAEKYPDVDWSRYYDSYEMLMAYGGMLARERGFKAISLTDHSGGTPEFVALTDDILAEGKPSSKAFHEERFAAQEAARVSVGEVDLAKGFAKSKKAEIAARSAEAETYRPGLNRASDLLNEIFTLGESELATGRVIPTALDNVKTRLRLMAGDEMRVTFGDGNTPVIVKSLPTRAARWALAPQARGSISLIEADLGSRQLADALRRSKQFSEAEVKATSNRLLTTPPARRAAVIAEVQKDMLERVAMKHFGEDRTPEEALAYARELTQSAIKEWGQGNEWVTRAANEQKGRGKVMYRTPDNVSVAVDEAMLQSQLADNAPFLDPEVFEKAILKHKGDIKSNLIAKKDALIGLNDAATSLWKHGALLRPGLAVRAALDTEMRSLALMSTAETAMMAANAAANALRNRGSAVSRVLFRNGDIAKQAQARISVDQRPVTVDVGDGKKFTSAFARNADERTRNQTAMTKGADTPWKFYFTETTKHLNRYRTDRAKWARKKADSPHWVSSYLEYAEQLLASPTARWIVQHGDENRPLSELLDSKEFKREFEKVAVPKGFTRWEFARQVMHEVELMFPDGALADKVMSHTLTPKLVEKTFPKGSRFDVPGPDVSAIDNTWTDRAREFTGRAYRLFLDKPDMWLSRNPTGTAIYRRELQNEAAALRRQYPNGDIPEKALDLMDRRARTKAISTVRRSFFDPTRHTGMHETVARISPFFAAWEDAMMSWSRLIYDDPRRLVKLSAGYNAAGTLSPYLPQPLLVDNDGKPIRRGQAHDNGAYIAVPFKVNGVQMRVRLEALNSIAQGETWWLPGFGPQATVATSQVLGRFMSKETALNIVGTDNWLGQQVLQSMFLDGEIPKTDLGSTAQSLLPSTVRNAAKDWFGDNFARNVQYNMNWRIAEATKQGKKLSDADLRKFYNESAKTAHAAAVVRLISGSGLGMTGNAVVDGQFYVEEMRNAEAVPKDQLKAMGFNSPEEYFAHLHPEAADLDWHLTTNETGISASVNAAMSGEKLNGVLKSYPTEFGWMVLGRDNLGPDGGPAEFSSSVYNMQVSSGDRDRVSAEDARKNVEASVGWRDYQHMRTDLSELAEEFGLSASDPILADVKREYVKMLMQRNSAWADEYSTRVDNFGKTYATALNLSKDKRVASRSDMVAFRDYDEARNEVMAEFGLKTLNGTGPEAMAAKDVLRQVGETLAAKDFGFQQLWDRFLSGEVEEQ